MIAVGLADLNWTSIERINTDVTDESAVVLTYDERIIISANNEIKLYDVDGVLITKRKINSTSTKIIGMSDYFVVADLLQGNVHILDYEGKTIASVEKLGPLNDIISANNNMFVVITNKNILHVISPSGGIDANVELPEGELLGLDVSKDKENVIATILTSDDDQFNSKIIAFSMDESLMVGGYNNYSTIVYGTKVYEDHIMIVDTKGEHAYRLGDSEDYTWQVDRNGDLIYFDIDANGSILEILRRKNVNTAEFRLTAVTKDGEEIFDKKLSQKYTKIVLTQGKILLQNDKSLEIRSSDGILLATYESSKKINDIKWLTEERLVIEYKDHVEILQLAY